MNPDIQIEMKTLLYLVGDFLSEPQKKVILDLIKAGEFRLATETMCDILYENEFDISLKTYKLIEKISISLKMENEVFNVLKSQIRD
jgi:hypothetical protein